MSFFVVLYNLDEPGLLLITSTCQMKNHYFIHLCYELYNSTSYSLKTTSHSAIEQNPAAWFTHKPPQN